VAERRGRVSKDTFTTDVRKIGRVPVGATISVVGDDVIVVVVVVVVVIVVVVIVVVIGVAVVVVVVTVVSRPDLTLRCKRCKLCYAAPHDYIVNIIMQPAPITSPPPRRLFAQVDKVEATLPRCHSPRNTTCAYILADLCNT